MPVVRERKNLTLDVRLFGFSVLRCIWLSSGVSVPGAAIHRGCSVSGVNARPEGKGRLEDHLHWTYQLQVAAIHMLQGHLQVALLDTLYPTGQVYAAYQW